jgi:hypothetical protein
VSVRALRFNPVFWLTIVTLTPGTTAPLGSVMVPETVASWVCDDALATKRAASATDSMQGPHHPRFAASVLIVMNSLWFFVMASVNLDQQTVSSHSAIRPETWRLLNSSRWHDTVQPPTAEWGAPPWIDVP